MIGGDGECIVEASTIFSLPLVRTNRRTAPWSRPSALPATEPPTRRRAPDRRTRREQSYRGDSAELMVEPVVGESDVTGRVRLGSRSGELSASAG